MPSTRSATKQNERVCEPSPNTVNPSPVETRMMRSIESGMVPEAPESIKERMVEAIPAGRYGEPGDIAKVMLFLASDDAEFVNGSVYMADGGFTA